jgi:cyclase
MLKKRLIFTLLFNNGKFVLSRNFRLQEVGDRNWLQTHYNFSSISRAIDELIILDVSRNYVDSEFFLENVKQITKGCFVPITIGGHLHTLKQSKQFLNSGADKLLVNSILFSQEELIFELASEYGQQCLVACLDYKKHLETIEILTCQGSMNQLESAKNILEKTLDLPVGELILNSIDRDGTGQGLEFEILNLLPKCISKPIILSGGVGNPKHLLEGLRNRQIDAVATANLFNFVGDGLINARNYLTQNGVNLAMWNNTFFEMKKSL